MEEQIITTPTKQEIEKYRTWWQGLNESWKNAFNQVYCKRSGVEEPDEDVLHMIWTSSVMRFAGPRAMHPNMDFELTELSGLSALIQLKILVVIEHQLASLSGIEGMVDLESLFVFGNQLTDISQVSGLKSLHEIYIQDNKVTSLMPLENLTHLKTVYCPRNLLSNLDGIGEQHADALVNFTCLPNDLLKDRDVIKFEQQYGIRCKKG